MYGGIGVSASSLHRESTDSLMTMATCTCILLPSVPSGSICYKHMYIHTKMSQYKYKIEWDVGTNHWYKAGNIIVHSSILTGFIFMGRNIGERLCMITSPAIIHGM